MVKDKIREKGESEEQADTASRARNRTVMLTPEMTGQVRALLNTDKIAGNEEFPDNKTEVDDYLPPSSWSNSFEEHLDTKVVSKDLEEIIPPPNKVSDERIFGSGSGFGEGFSERNFQTSINKVETKGETMHDMDTHKQPAYAVNAAPSSTSVSSQPLVAKKRKGKVIAFLISYDKEKNGEVYELSSGRWFITSKPTDHGEYILVEDETVSPSHAIIRATESGKIHVLDQLSECGTFVVTPGSSQEDEAIGQVALEHGYMVRFGNRRFMVCLVPAMPNL